MPTEAQIVANRLNAQKSTVGECPRPNETADGDSETPLGRVVVRDFVNYGALDRLGLYERRIEHSLYRTMGELQKRRPLRELEPPAEETTPTSIFPGAEPASSCPGSMRRGSTQALGMPPTEPTNEQIRQTKPISPDDGAENASGGRTKPDESRSCLTGVRATGNIPASGGSDRRRMGFPASVPIQVSRVREQMYSRPTRGTSGPATAEPSKDYDNGDNGSQAFQST